MVPIPKPDNAGFRPISLLPCLSKVMGSAILAKLKTSARPLHSHTLGFKKGAGTTEDVAALVISTHKAHSSTAMFLHLGKAFELATAALAALAEAGVLALIQDFLADRQATLQYQIGRSPTTDSERLGGQRMTLKLAGKQMS